MKRIAAILVVQTLLLFPLSLAGASIRLGIGAFGLTPERRDGDLADLIVARLSAVPEFDLIERRELNAILKESSLSLTGIVRAKDAVRLGALLRVDQFLLGSSTPINGTNRIFIRLVNARTGVIEAVNVFRDIGSLDTLVGGIANFVRAESRNPQRGHRDYLAIGVIQNLGVNNRFSDFPAQMRGSVAVGLSGKATVLERDVISFLANEVRLDMAGLTEREGAPTPGMQFGFWIVDGFYQSYEVAEPEVQLKLRVERVPGAQQSFMLQGKPDEEFLKKISDSIAKALSQPVAQGSKVAATQQSEIAALEARSKQLVDYVRPRAVVSESIQIRAAQNPDKVMNTLDEATRVFESILLLDPENNAAKMRLAGCLLFEAENWRGVKRDHKQERSARACEYYREVISTEEPTNANDARINLARTCAGLEGVEMLARFGDETDDPKESQRFRYYRNELLLDMEYRLPIEAVLPHVERQQLEALTALQSSAKEEVFIDFSGALFAWRNDPRKREQVINALLPEIMGKFPALKPHILLAASAEQITTNSPVTAQFLTSLRTCEEHPEAVWHASSYFTHLSSTLEEEKYIRDHGGYTLLQRTFLSGQFTSVVAQALARQRAAEKGLAPPLTAIGKMRLAESYMALKQWKEALEVFNELPDASPQVKNECRSHLGVAAESEELPDSAWKDKSDLEKVQIAYRCIERGQQSTALSILESMGHRTIRMDGSGPWGFAFTPVFPAVVADELRTKAGKPSLKDPMRFEIGQKPYLSFVLEEPYPFSFEVEGEDLWVGFYNKILFRADSGTKPDERHVFESSTETANTSICVSKNFVWAGTLGEGLLELDRKTGTCRRLTMSDGLLLNGISGLKLQGQTLWIAYRNGDNGAVGTLDWASHKISTLTPKLSPGAGANSQPYYNQTALDDLHQAPHLPISCMTEGDPGEMWFAVKGKGLQRFRSSNGGWDTLPQVSARGGFLLAMVAEPTHGLLLLANSSFDLLPDGAKSKIGGLIIYDYRQNKQELLQIYQGLPSNHVTAVAVDGRIAWVGGLGFVAVIDVEERKVLRIAYLSASQIRGIQLSRAHAWIAISCAKEERPDYCGNARTGIYRVDRVGIESGVDSSSQK